MRGHLEKGAQGPEGSAYWNCWECGGLRGDQEGAAKRMGGGGKLPLSRRASALYRL